MVVLERVCSTARVPPLELDGGARRATTWALALALAVAAVGRFGRGTFGEPAGCGSVPSDIQQRTLTYSDAEYDEMFALLSPDARDAVLGYVDGANAWRIHVMTDPLALPAEYGLLTTFPEPFTVKAGRGG